MPNYDMGRPWKSDPDLLAGRDIAIGQGPQRPGSADHCRRWYLMSPDERNAVEAIPIHQLLTPTPSPVEQAAAVPINDDRGPDERRRETNIDTYITEGFGPHIPTEIHHRRNVLDQVQAIGIKEKRFLMYVRSIRNQADVVYQYLGSQGASHVLECAKTAIDGAMIAYLQDSKIDHLMQAMSNVNDSLVLMNITGPGPRFRRGGPGSGYRGGGPGSGYRGGGPSSGYGRGWS